MAPHLTNERGSLRFATARPWPANESPHDPPVPSMWFAESLSCFTHGARGQMRPLQKRDRSQVAPYDFVARRIRRDRVAVAASCARRLLGALVWALPRRGTRAREARA